MVGSCTIQLTTSGALLSVIRHDMRLLPYAVGPGEDDRQAAYIG